MQCSAPLHHSKKVPGLKLLGVCMFALGVHWFLHVQCNMLQHIRQYMSAQPSQTIQQQYSVLPILNVIIYFQSDCLLLYFNCSSRIHPDSFRLIISILSVCLLTSDSLCKTALWVGRLEPHNSDDTWCLKAWCIFQNCCNILRAQQKDQTVSNDWLRAAIDHMMLCWLWDFLRAAFSHLRFTNWWIIQF